MRTGACALALSFCVPLALSGNLIPPAPPVGTMTTLEEIGAHADPRTPIRQSDIPMVINTPGSYVLAENVSVATGIGIQINANNVTLDLNGFTISGGGAIGIQVNGTVGAWIRNGRVRNFSSGNGVDLGTGTTACVVEDMEISLNGFGVSIATASANCVVRRCRIISNSSHGISVDSAFNCEVRDCMIASNGGAGINLVNAQRVILTDNLLEGNFHGIQIDAGSANLLIQGNRLFFNANTGLLNSGTGSFILGNLAASNLTNYSGVALTASASTTLGPFANVQP